ncbi:hypothetical protein BC831DRAFT_139413 [Entophlyctis helioformis]|nr:hypothetical protein BC831DRAFT_139413 [Entophlyctis helioformis]
MSARRHSTANRAGIQQVQAQVLQAQLHNLQQMQQMQQQAHDQQAHNQREPQPQLDDLEHTQQQHRLDSLSLGRLMLTDDDLDGSDCDISSVTEFGVCLNDGCEGGGSAGSSDRRRRQRQRRRRQMWQQQQQQAVVAMPDSPRCSSPSEDRSVQPSADHSKLRWAARYCRHHHQQQPHHQHHHHCSRSRHRCSRHRRRPRCSGCRSRCTAASLVRRPHRPHPRPSRACRPFADSASPSRPCSTNPSIRSLHPANALPCPRRQPARAGQPHLHLQPQRQPQRQPHLHPQPHLRHLQRPNHRPIRRRHRSHCADGRGNRGRRCRSSSAAARQATRASLACLSCGRCLRPHHSHSHNHSRNLFWRPALASRLDRRMLRQCGAGPWPWPRPLLGRASWACCAPFNKPLGAAC